MSRIGKIPVSIPAGVEVKVEGKSLRAKGSLGELTVAIPEGITVKVEAGAVQVDNILGTKQARAYHGLVRSLVANAIDGVTKGYEKTLLIEGVGFRAALQAPNLSLALGFASPIIFKIPSTVTVKETGGTKLVVSGIDKQQVGQVSARIRSYFPAEPYKGKGIRYSDEKVKRKEGKTVA